jgi:ArsR family transcriptional regulator
MAYDPAMVEPERAAHFRLHAEICKVLTEPKRLMLVDALRHGERSVGELAEAIGVSLPNASQHLTVMRGAGLVEGRRAGTTVRYRLVEPAIVEACAIIDRIIDRRLAGPRTHPAAPAVPSAPFLTTPSSASPADSHSQPARR